MGRTIAGILVSMLLSAAGPQATIIDTGSTNRPGSRVTVDVEGNAIVEPRNADVVRMKLPEDLCKQLMHDIAAAEPLSALPAVHCMKSVSFGSSLFIEHDGNRSPDLNCPSQRDDRAAALQKDAKEILKAARATGPSPGPR
ncbi:MAG: hypothetical protein WB992_21525 [Bryobacteraceae bacterium]